MTGIGKKHVMTGTFGSLGSCTYLHSKLMCLTFAKTSREQTILRVLNLTPQI